MDQLERVSRKDMQQHNLRNYLNAMCTKVETETEPEVTKLMKKASVGCRERPPLVERDEQITVAPYLIFDVPN